jgi:chloramphenicol-sensitive protein RarD
VSDPIDPPLRNGLAYGLTAFVAWGLMPLYFGSVRHVPAWEVLALRIVCTLVLLTVVLSVTQLWPNVRRGLADPRTRRWLLLSSVLIALNWLAYIYGVTQGRIAETALGYYLLPLVNVALGVVVFRERLRPAQAAALALAGVGVALAFRAAHTTGVPWVAVALTVSFALYGLVRKVAPVDGLSGLMVEAVVLAPLAVTYLGWLAAAGDLRFGHIDRRTDLLLLASGIVTAVPLVCFAQAARRLPLTTMGFLQYISPSMQLLLAVVVFGEAFAADRQLSFGCIWAGLAVYSLDAALAGRRAAAPAGEPA